MKKLFAISLVIIATLSFVFTYSYWSDELGSSSAIKGYDTKQSERLKTFGANEVGNGKNNYVMVDVLYATNRNLLGNANDSCESKYGGERAPISYGVCKVSIPPGHVRGEIESPFFYFINVNNPEKYVVMHPSELLSAELFKLIVASEAIKGARASLLFVHGFNVTFSDAAKRTAQMAFDLEFRGVPILYSWPSAGNFQAYPADEAAIEWAEGEFYKFLESHLETPGVEHLYIIAHSMGNRIVTKIVNRLAETKPELAKKLQQVVLASPDIDQGVFRDNIAPTLAKLGAPVTIYASSKDLALQASKKFHAYPRQGEMSSSYIAIDGIETIDTSLIETDFLGHSAYSDSDVILADIYQMFSKSERASERYRLKKMTGAGGQYWQLQP
ncbi:alpha/beta hydrolase [Pseudomonas sp.]|uniref:alpha/beta hydrolase n=1 Tax=Pseudomonas sp. TaxID=306 RepID=UPI003A970D4E